MMMTIAMAMRTNTPTATPIIIDWLGLVLSPDRNIADTPLSLSGNMVNNSVTTGKQVA